jgi:hypothetical protein
MNNQRWQIWLTALAGLWAFVSPWVLANAASTVAAPLSSGAEWDLWIVGAAIVVLAVAAVLAYQPWEEWAAALVGVWLVASPWIFGFSDATAMTWSTVIAGVVIVVAAAWAVLANPGTGRLASQ